MNLLIIPRMTDLSNKNDMHCLLSWLCRLETTLEFVGDYSNTSNKYISQPLFGRFRGNILNETIKEGKAN